MLSFFAVRGITPEYILSLTTLERGFYKRSMDLYYGELYEIICALRGVKPE